MTYPDLHGFGRLPLGTFPSALTLIEVAPGTRVWCKDESRVHPCYGGNKVRKLEYFLYSAQERGATRLVVWGDTLSHTVEAIALLGNEAGFEVEPVVYVGRSARTVSELECLLGTRVLEAPNFPTAWLKARLRAMRPGTMYVPLGVTTAYACLGFVSAIAELAGQLKAFASPWPEKIFVALGSGGTVAGLAVGLALVGVPARIHAVRTVERVLVGQAAVERQVAELLQLLGCGGLSARDIVQRRVVFEEGFLGRGHGDVTTESLEAVERGRDFKLELEPVFTGKVMAAVLCEAAEGMDGKILFWNTHDGNQTREP